MKRKVVSGPAAAFRFVVGACQFAEADGDAHPIRGLARSALPVMHPYFGAIYHDFSGMKLDGDRVPLDYCHCEGEVLGYANEFPVDDEGLHIVGALLPFGQDRAAEVIAKSRGGQGVPYQLSIDFRGDDITAEEVPEGATSEVNGQTVNGPALIFRQWPLRGVAVCPYGKDRNTNAQFSDQDGEELTVRILSEGTMPKPKSPSRKPAPAVRQMTAGAKKKTPAKGTKVNRQMADDPKPDEQQDDDEQQEEDDEDPDTTDGGQDDTKNDPDSQDDEDETLDDDEQQQDEDEDQPKPDQQQSERGRVRTELKRFVKAFGQQAGTQYFLDGLTFSAATSADNKRLRDELKRTNRQLAVKSSRLEQLAQDGEDEPLSQSEDDESPAPKGRSSKPLGGQYSATIGTKLGMFADSMKMPK